MHWIFIYLYIALGNIYYSNIWILLLKVVYKQFIHSWNYFKFEIKIINWKLEVLENLEY